MKCSFCDDEALYSITCTRCARRSFGCEAHQVAGCDEKARPIVVPLDADLLAALAASRAAEQPAAAAATAAAATAAAPTTATAATATAAAATAAAAAPAPAPGPVGLVTPEEFDLHLANAVPGMPLELRGLVFAYQRRRYAACERCLFVAAPEGSVARCPQCGTAMRDLPLHRRLPVRLGLELETDIRVLGGAQYQDVLARGEGWRAVADGPPGNTIVEMVTEAYDNLGDVLDVLFAAHAYAHGLFSAGSGGFPGDRALTWTIDPRPAAAGASGAAAAAAAARPTEMVAAPQASMGVPIGRLMRLLEKAQEFVLHEHLMSGATSKLGQTRLLQKTRGDAGENPIAYARTWGTEMHRLDPSVSAGDAEAATGLMALILLVLDNGYHAGDTDYVKNVFVILHRTNYRAMYEALAVSARRWFTLGTVMWAFVGIPNDVPAPRRGASLDATLAAFDAFAERREDGARSALYRAQPVLRRGFPLAECRAAAQRVATLQRDRILRDFRGVDKLFGPTVEEWIESIIRPPGWRPPDGTSAWDELASHLVGVTVADLNRRDLLSRGMCLVDSSSLGRYELVNGIVILEFRAWPGRSLPARLWASLATRLFLMLCEVCEVR